MTPKDPEPSSGSSALGGWGPERLRWTGRLLLLAGLVIAGAGLATFHAPICTGGGPSSPATCTPWETSQWLMITGVLLAVVALLLLAGLAKMDASS